MYGPNTELQTDSGIQNGPWVLPIHGGLVCKNTVQYSRGHKRSAYEYEFGDFWGVCL